MPILIIFYYCQLFHIQAYMIIHSCYICFYPLYGYQNKAE